MLLQKMRNFSNCTETFTRRTASNYVIGVIHILESCRDELQIEGDMEMKKYGWMIILAFFVWLLPVYNQAAAAGTSLFMNGERLDTGANAGPEMVNGKVMVPLRVVGEQLGYQFNWEPEQFKITIHKDQSEMAMYVGRTMAYVGSEEVSLDTPPLLRGNSTMVPLRFVGEQMGLKVDWNNATKTVYLESNTGSGAGGKGTVSSGNVDNEKPVPTTPVDSEPAVMPGNESTPDTGSATGDNDTSDTSDTNEQQLIRDILFSDNRLTVRTDSGLKPSVFTMTGPDRIVIDFAGAGFAGELKDAFPLGTSGSRELEIYDDPAVKQIRFAMFNEGSTSSARIVLQLNTAKEYILSNEGDDSIVISLQDKQGPIITPSGESGRHVVVLDAGHGGSDPGASSVTGRKEKEFNLAVALLVQQQLQNDPDIELVLTRNGDTYPGLKDRSSLANQVNANLFVSIHANSLEKSEKNALINGSETYYTKADSKAFADVMHKHLIAATGLKDNGVRVKNLHVTRETKMPAVLLEAGYLSNVNDEAVLFTPDTQQRIADGIVAGIKEYLGLQ